MLLPQELDILEMNRKYRLIRLMLVFHQARRFPPIRVHSSKLTCIGPTSVWGVPSSCLSNPLYYQNNVAKPLLTSVRTMIIILRLTKHDQ